MAALIPIRFGDRQRQLFGVFHSPHARSARHCVVLCNPFGQEAIRAHRFLRVLADRLARAGFPVLRFDYFGTGDSDGDDTEGDLHTWVGDLLQADIEARRRSAHRVSAWFGLRLGATIAALAAHRAEVVPCRLVLWDPVVDGTAYLRELQAAHDTALSIEPSRNALLPGADATDDRLAGTEAEALGFPLTNAVRRQMGSLTAAMWASNRLPDVTLIASRESLDASSLAGRLGGAGTPVDVRRIESQIVWASDEAMDTAVVPPDALQAAVSALQAST